jgi:hypothetical protein
MLAYGVTNFDALLWLLSAAEASGRDNFLTRIAAVIHSILIALPQLLLLVRWNGCGLTRLGQSATGDLCFIFCIAGARNVGFICGVGER